MKFNLIIFFLFSLFSLSIAYKINYITPLNIPISFSKAYLKEKYRGYPHQVPFLFPGRRRCRAFAELQMLSETAACRGFSAWIVRPHSFSLFQKEFAKREVEALVRAQHGWPAGWCGGGDGCCCVWWLRLWWRRW